MNTPDTSNANIARTLREAAARISTKYEVAEVTKRRALDLADALDRQPAPMTWEERTNAAREALTEYDRRDHAWNMKEAADLALRAAFPECAP
jgi:DNA-directed RNA polymerase subunit K/omega